MTCVKPDKHGESSMTVSKVSHIFGYQYLADATMQSSGPGMPMIVERLHCHRRAPSLSS